jgi:hypothetical protein
MSGARMRRENNERGMQRCTFDLTKNLWYHALKKGISIVKGVFAPE